MLRHSGFRSRSLAALAGAALLASSCGPVADPRGLVAVDLRPPVVEGVRSVGPGALELRFDEEAEVERESLRIAPELEVRDVSAPARLVTVAVAQQAPGRPYRLEATARDLRGNETTFLADFRGFNPRVPRLLINELSPRGSSAHPDLVELAVASDGDLGGVTLYVGTPAAADLRLVFPPLAVAAGSFVLVHCRPTGDPSEIDELSHPAASGGLDASPHAWDFWLAEGQGLGGNNGALTLCDRPGGSVLDAVLWSNRTSGSDETWRGFGSETNLARAEELVRAGAWRAAGALVAPEDCVNPEGSAATRSLCRSSTSADTDGKEDWHIAPTRGATFGAENTDEVYVP